MHHHLELLLQIDADTFKIRNIFDHLIYDINFFRLFVSFKYPPTPYAKCHP